MKVRSLVLCSAVLCSLYGADPALTQIKAVYLLPMSGGLDQYLVNKLARDGRFQVVTDPAKADAVFTDRVGADFEARMNDLYPPPAPPAKETADKKDEKKKDDSLATLFTDKAGGTVNRTSSFSRSKGNVFLVDRASRRVVWAYYLRPRSTQADELNRVANAIADKLDDTVEHMTKTAAKADRKAVESMPPLPAAAPPAPAPAPPAVAAPPVVAPPVAAPKPAPAPPPAK